MKRLHVFAFASSVSMILAGVLAACTSEDTIVTNDDAGGDSSNPPDTSVPDTGTPDTSVPDGGDAGLFTVETYDDQIADTLCNTLTRCCYGNPEVPQDGGVDGGAAGSGAFDRASCHKLYATLGFESSNVGIAKTTENVVVNQAKANDCVAKINALSCNLDGPSLKTIRAACFGALQGQLVAGDLCKTSLQCGAGLFCQSPPEADGGALDDAGTVGVCSPLRPQGQGCSIQDTGTRAVDSTASEIACSSRGGGDTNLACASYDLVTGNYKIDRSQWTCQPQVANGEWCNTTVSCASGICEPGTFKCQPALTYFNDVACKQYLRQ